MSSIVEICAVISAVAAVFSCFISLANNWTIRIVHRETNSMKDELVRATKIGSEAVGEARGRLMQKEEQDRINK